MMIRLTLVMLLVSSTAALAAGRPVTFPSLDGTSLAGEIYESSTRPAPGVVFVHMLSRNRGDWRDLPDRIREAGITALTIDLRGHGASSGSQGDLKGMVQDVRAAVQWLGTRGNVPPAAIAIVGASMGGSLALLAAEALPQVQAVGVLSPSSDYRGLRTDLSLIKRLGSRRLWFAASAEDPLAARTMRDMAAEPSGPREQVLSNARAHGTVLLDRDGDVGRALVDWLRRSLL